MAKGGARQNAGRKPGSRNLITAQLAHAVQKTGETDLLRAAAAVFDDPTNDWRLRLDAGRIAFGVAVGRSYAQLDPRD